MKQIISYAILIAAIAIVVGGAEYAEKVHGVNWWLAAIPLLAVTWPLIYFRKRRA